MNKKELRNLYSKVNIAVCVHCMTAKYAMAHEYSNTLKMLDKQSKCCKDPYYFWNIGEYKQ